MSRENDKIKLKYILFIFIDFILIQMNSIYFSMSVLKP